MPNRLCAAVCAVAVVVGCGGDGGAGAPGVSVGAPGDAGGLLDGGLDPGLPARPDAAAHDPCAVEEDSLFDLVVTRDAPDVAHLSVLPGSSRFGLAYVDESDACLDALYVAELRGGPSEGGPAIRAAVDACSQIERGTLTTFGSQWLLASVDNREPPSDLWVQALEPDAQAADGASAAHRVTSDGAREGSLALAAFDGSRALVAWVSRDVMTGVESLRVRALGPGGRPVAPAVSLELGEGWVPTLPTLSRLGARMGLAYHRHGPGGRSQAVLELLDPDTGARVREPWILTEDAGPEPSISLAADAGGGAVLYSRSGGGSGRQLWFQRLDEHGDPAPTMSGTAVGAPSGPVRVVNSPMRAIDGSIVKLVTGYAVAYRALPGGGVEEPRIRLHFLDRFGRIFGDSEVAATTPTGGRTSLAFSIEGRMVVGWSDRTDAGQTLVRMARVPCLGE